MRTALLLIVVLWSASCSWVHALQVSPNSLLGSCLDDAWVASVESELSISADDRDVDGDKLHPFLHKALTEPRFWIEDPRTAKDMNKLYQPDCLEAGEVFYGVGSTIDANENIVDPGYVNGTLVVELHPYSSLRVSTMLFAILAQELLGYKISYLSLQTKTRSAQRMSSSGAGLCSPSHVLLEVRSDGETDSFLNYSQETYSSASIGYFGRGGMYTTTKLINDGQNASLFSPTFDADFWRDYVDNDDLIDSLPVSTLTSNSDYFPPSYETCANGTLGCENYCTWTETCADRMAAGNECLLVVMFDSLIDTGYLPAVLSNLGIPGKLCYIGSTASTAFVTEMVKNDTPVVFYYYEPELMPVRLDGLIQRVSLPSYTPKLAAENTATFGEDGPGTATSNPVKVDFPYVELDKYSSTVIQDSPPIESLINRISLSSFEIDQLIRRHAAYLSLPNPPPRPGFSAACAWLKVPNNYKIWSQWLDQLPKCTVEQHVTYTFVGCSANETEDEAFPRIINFDWKLPDPRDPSKPYNCDGALTTLPPSIETSKTCNWLSTHFSTWIQWTDTKPTCFAEHYSYSVSSCDSKTSLRTIEFFWKIPDSDNASLSRECTGGIQLPDTTHIECEYVMYESNAFVIALVCAVLFGVCLVLCFAYVVHFRHAPIIKRSQYQFLLTMIVGALLLTLATITYAGPPSSATCVIRPTILTYGFTLVFGSLMVKSLRVYRVFMKSAMKRVVLSAVTMFKILAVILIIDTVLLLLWFLVDPGLAVTTPKDVTTESGVVTVPMEACKSTSFLFNALLIFWKAMMLFAGLYLSFLIRKVSADFQESTWIFSSSLVVLFSSLLLLGLAYLVQLTATAFYLLFVFLLQTSICIVATLMLLPKLLRHRENVAQNTATADTTSSGTSSSDMKGVVPDGSGPTPRKLPGSSLLSGKSQHISFFSKKSNNNVVPLSVQVTPVEAFSGRSESNKTFKQRSVNSHASASSRKLPSQTPE